MASEDPLTASERSELEALRRRVAELEEQRQEEIAGAMAAAAQAQERAYWLDHWHVDLNAWMATRAGITARAAYRAVRPVLRAIRSVVEAVRRMRR